MKPEQHVLDQHPSIQLAQTKRYLRLRWAVGSLVVEHSDSTDPKTFKPVTRNGD